MEWGCYLKVDLTYFARLHQREPKATEQSRSPHTPIEMSGPATDLRAFFI